MCQIQRVRQGQAGKGRMKSVARKGLGQAGWGIGQTWWGPSCLKEPHQASLSGHPGLPMTAAQGFQMRGTQTQALPASALASAPQNRPGHNGLPSPPLTYPYPMLTLLSRAPAHPLLRSSPHPFTCQAALLGYPWATEHPREPSPPSRHPPRS